MMTSKDGQIFQLSDSDCEDNQTCIVEIFHFAHDEGEAYQTEVMVNIFGCIIITNAAESF